DWTNNEGSIYGEGGSTGKSFIPGNTTACVAIVYDINGNQKPNEVGKDIGELNAVLGDDDCVRVGSMCISKTNVSYSPYGTFVYTPDGSIRDNRWAGAVKVCEDMGWHLPSVNELKYILTAVNKNAGIKNLSGVNGFYWSSSNGTETYSGYIARCVWWRNAINGPSLTTSTKDSSGIVRCVK
ncbi:MAG: hypothetical protein PHC64_08125, partial [Candidatus Gastranaerophilales bacterium]|nr:hypothetical protein [Candidatus Gastranaerophilales bacterium]